MPDESTNNLASAPSGGTPGTSTAATPAITVHTVDADIQVAAAALKHLNLSKDIHQKTFLLGIVSAILTTAVALGVPMTAHQTVMIQDAAGMIIAMVLGGSAVSIVHGQAASKLIHAIKGPAT